MLGQGIGVGDRHGDIFGKCSVHRVANSVPVLAEIALSVTTKKTTTTKNRRIDRDPGANGELLCSAAPLEGSSHGHYFARKFMAGHDRIRSRWKFALGNV